MIYCAVKLRTVSDGGRKSLYVLMLPAGEVHHVTFGWVWMWPAGLSVAVSFYNAECDLHSLALFPDHGMRQKLRTHLKWRGWSTIKATPVHCASVLLSSNLQAGVEKHLVLVIQPTWLVLDDGRGWDYVPELPQNRSPPVGPALWHSYHVGNEWSNVCQAVFMLIHFKLLSCRNKTKTPQTFKVMQWNLQWYQNYYLTLSTTVKSFRFTGINTYTSWIYIITITQMNDQISWCH